MNLIAAFEWGLGGLFAGFAGLVLLRLLSGEIPIRGLLQASADAPIAPERLQAVGIAVGIPLLYAARVFQTMQGAAPLEGLPDVPEWMLILATGSQTLYLGGKIARMSRPSP